MTNTTSGCAGALPGVPRLGFPGLCLGDNGNGIRSTDYINAYAAGLSVAASWNAPLAEQRAQFMGAEFRTKGISVSLGPVVSPIGRLALDGRLWEGLGSDPYLAGVLAAKSIAGVQSQNVIACIKHLIAYEQETLRQPSTNANGSSVAAVSSNIDDKTMHELYLWPFMDAVHAGAASAMCSYQRVNNSYACQNSKVINGLLKEELGFQGFVVSDWTAVYGGIAGANAGLDMVMPTGALWNNLTGAVANGSLAESRLDDMVTRTLAAWYLTEQDSKAAPLGIGMPGPGPNTPHKRVNARDPAAKQTILAGAVEGHVLVKNTGVLPLKSPVLLGIFGYAASTPPRNNPSSSFVGQYEWSLGVQTSGVDPLQALLGAAIAGTNRSAAYAPAGTLFYGGGSGYAAPPYISSPFEEIARRAYEDNTSLYWDFNASSPEVDPTTDACLVFVNSWATEGADRPGLYDDFSDDIISNVASVCNNTIVVLQNPGPRLVDNFQDHPNVTAILFTHVPGQDTGRATVGILYGDYNPSGKLPYTVAKNETDYPVPEPSVGEGEFALFPQSNFTEGIFTDYRWFDEKNITPRYEFGFGLSYSTFVYSDLRISAIGAIAGKKVEKRGTCPSEPVAPGGPPDLWAVLYTVAIQVKNIAHIAGAEVAQLYVGIPGGPVRQLRGFVKAFVEAGKAEAVSFQLTRRDLSHWDVVAQTWVLQTGNYTVYVGSSSRNLPLVGTIEVSE